MICSFPCKHMQRYKTDTTMRNTRKEEVAGAGRYGETGRDEDSMEIGDDKAICLVPCALDYIILYYSIL